MRITLNLSGVRALPLTRQDPPMTDLTAPLPEDRHLGYREYGDPAGRPVVSCHGGLLCGLDAAAYDTAATSPPSSTTSRSTGPASSDGRWAVSTRSRAQPASPTG